MDCFTLGGKSGRFRDFLSKFRNFALVSREKLNLFRNFLSKSRNLEILFDFFQQSQLKKAPIRKESELFNIILMAQSRCDGVAQFHLSMF